MTICRDIISACESVAASLGYPHLKEEQRSVIINFVTGNDVFAVMPTGYGKTLCYACLPSLFDQLLGTDSSIVVVVSPLTLIMMDQVIMYKMCVYLNVLAD